MKYALTSFMLLLSITFFSIQWLVVDQQTFPTEEKINLAMRKVGHQLLLAFGDKTSQIPPVSRPEVGEYILTINHPINYDTLPAIMDRELSHFGIKEDYQVLVQSCEGDTIILGFTHLSFLQNEVACTGRENPATCQQIALILDKSGFTNSWSWAGIILGILGLIMVTRIYHQSSTNSIEQPEKNPEYQLGQSSFDASNQIFTSNGNSTTLTFRENKLLKLFVDYPNQVIAREKILAEVWGDEGVIVGRSLDVFVSRLRKIIKVDPGLQIKSIHGVGYRLEVK